MNSKYKTNDEINLFYARNQCGNVPTLDEDEKLNLNSLLEKLNEMYSKISTDISVIIDKKISTVGVWDPEQKLVHIIEERHVKQYISSIQGNSKCLKPFEALFLLECRSLTLLFRDLSLSIEDAYQLLLQNERDQKLYKIFSTLSRAGYYVDHVVPKEINTQRYEIPKSNQYGIKRTNEMLEMESDCQRKKINTKPQNFNWVINNIRTLKLNNIPRINRIDKELLKQYEKHPNSNESNSYLYCAKKSSRPTNIPALLCPLYSEKTKPVIPLGSIYDTDHLFESIQNESPINSLPGINENNNVNIDFVVYSSRKQKNNGQKSLFSIIMVDEDQPLPSIEKISHLIQSLENNSIFFAVLSQSLNFNFYSFENLKIKKCYPRLWEQ